MSASAPCPPDHPLMIAWNAYKATEEYPNTKKWAAYPEHVEGSLWAAFMAGFNAQSACISEERSRAQYAVVRGLKMAEALRAILDVVEGKVITENESAAMNVICAIADDTLEEAAK